MMNLLLLTAANATEPTEGGFDHFFQDLVITEPLPQADWICGETVTVVWNKGINIRDGTDTTPPTPASGKINIMLASHGINPTATENITKYTIGVDVEIAAEEFEFNVDCEALAHLCPDCLDEDGKLKAVDDDTVYTRKMWNFLLFEDAALSENPLCKPSALNYDQDTCWSLRSEGTVNVANMTYIEGDKRGRESEIFTEAGWWYNESTRPVGPHMWGLAALWSQRSGFYMESGDELEFPYGFGKWDVDYADYRGVVGCNVATSQEENVIVVAFRPTTGAMYAYDDWMTNFQLQQNRCEDMLFGCEENMKFHRGFLLEYQASRDKLREAVLNSLKTANKCTGTDASGMRVLFTGMSQGGGIAQIGYFDIRNWLEDQLTTAEFEKIDFQIYTQGSPPSGNQHVALWFENNTLPYQRDRFVLRFDSDEGLHAGPMRVQDMSVGGLIDIASFDDVIECMDVPPPQGKDTPPYAGWAWKTAEELGDPEMTEEDVVIANSVSWQDGDIVTLMRSNPQCVGHWGELHLDSRFKRVQDPVFVHWDPDQSHVWCSADGCVATGVHDPPHPNAKEPARVSTKGYVHAEGQQNPRQCILPEGGSAAVNGVGCHDTGLYGHGISMLRNDEQILDNVAWKLNGENFSGCKATGATVDQPVTTFVPVLPTTRTPETSSTAEEQTTASATTAFATSLLALCLAFGF